MRGRKGGREGEENLLTCCYSLFVSYIHITAHALTVTQSCCLKSSREANNTTGIACKLLQSIQTEVSIANLYFTVMAARAWLLHHAAGGLPVTAAFWGRRLPKDCDACGRHRGRCDDDTWGYRKVYQWQGLLYQLELLAGMNN